jgi:hypothetical protein
MSLPKISHPLFDVVIPSTKTKIKIRPMLVKEEKILLMAKAGNDPVEILSSVKQVVNNCIIDESIDVDRLALFDVEYLFVRIRAVSIDNIIKISFKDKEDEKIYNFEANLDNVIVKFPEKLEKNIKITDNMMISLKYPEARLYSDKEFMGLPVENLLDALILKCVDKVYVEDEVYDAKNSSEVEITEFLNDLSIESYGKIRTFFASLPTLYYKIEYKNEKGSERTIEMKQLTDFFTLR